MQAYSIHLKHFRPLKIADTETFELWGECITAFLVLKSTQRHLARNIRIGRWADAASKHINCNKCRQEVPKARNACLQNAH